MSKGLIRGFSEKETKRIQTHLERLLPHLTPDKFTFVGGLAIRYHLAQKEIPYPHRAFNDLDMVAESADVVSEAVTEDFLIEHYHPQKGDLFYIVLVDPESKTKIDIFDNTMTPEEVIKVIFGQYIVKVQSAEDQLVKTVFDLQRVSSKIKVDPKQFTDARLLLQIVDVKKAELFWKKRTSSQLTLIDALRKAEIVARVHPEYLQEKPFRKNKPYQCPDCVSISKFPITPMEKICQVLGYIE